MATGLRVRKQAADLPVVAIDLPVLYEDDGQEEMGEHRVHTDTNDILFYGLCLRWRQVSMIHVLKNLNLLYHPRNRRAYISPDVMVVKTTQKLRKNLRSYRIGTTGPAPLLIAEVLSKRSFQQQDLTNKPKICAKLKVAEYLLADLTGEFLSERLLIRKLLPSGRWRVQQDRDGGITSDLGFRLVIEDDERLRVVDSATGHRYARPDEAEDSLEELKAAHQQLEAMKAENARLRRLLSESKTP
jgi:Uma2 family endonuclease